jgi:hypothetical protein
MDMTEEEEDSTPRRRETPADVLVRRAAKALVAPLHEQIGIWQAEAIKFEAIVGRAGTADEALIAATRVMLDQIVEEAASLDARLSAAPEPVRRHNWVTDTRKVLTVLEARVRQAMGRLEKPDPSAQ